MDLWRTLYFIFAYFQIGIDKHNIDKAFVQLTIEFLTKQVINYIFIYFCTNF